MGLSVLAYRQLKKVEGVFDPEGELRDATTGLVVEYAFQAFLTRDFLEYANGLEQSAVYDAAEIIGFTAGAYSVYGAWRNELAKMAGYPEVEGEDSKYPYSAGAWSADSGPFWELINFSDCEGIIGAVTAKKLAGDFAEWDERAEQHDKTTDFNGEFYRVFKDFRQAFEMAADNGAVKFA